MVPDNIVLKIHEQYLTDTNEQLLKRHRKRTGEQVYIGVIQKNVDQVLSTINSICNSGNKDQGLLKVATHILGAIALKQPFMDGNRRTAIIATAKFLRDNAYDLDIDSKDELELRLLLKKIKSRMFTLDEKVMEQMSFYISERMKEHESGR